MSADLLETDEQEGRQETCADHRSIGEKIERDERLSRVGQKRSQIGKAKRQTPPITSMTIIKPDRYPFD